MDTRTALIAEATELLRERGYSGFSYADLEKRVGIRKASIHHHFPSKEDLGVALVQAYSEAYFERLDQISRSKENARTMLEAYFAIYRDSLSQSLGCLCGTLAAEVGSIPDTVAAEVRAFLSRNREWLSRVVSKGQQEGSLIPERAADDEAEVLLSAAQGALLVSRASNDRSAFDRAVRAQLRLLSVT